ncbi:hypothetical protein RB195_013234 [Necator americanus]|uniref:Reverse transcriptase domain-containing protein n=1 Tax=Necator americanus TaxID=51031 RepID=A0ABR1DUR2_NECAM
MRNGWVSDAPFTLSGTDISECTSYVSLGREINMKDNLTPELGKRKRAAWRAYKSIEDVVKKTRNTRLRAHLFNTSVLRALTYASETWALRKQEENAVSVIERSIQRVIGTNGRFTGARSTRSNNNEIKVINCMPSMAAAAFPSKRSLCNSIF